MILVLFLLFLLSFIDVSHNFCIPGVFPVQFAEGDNVDVKAVKLTSLKTKLPYAHYSPRFCKPKDGLVYSSENLSKILRGDHIMNTPYRIKMLEKTVCSIVSHAITLSKSKSEQFRKRIEPPYSIHLLVDNLSVATRYPIGQVP